MPSTAEQFRAHWVHTGIHGPYRFTITDLAEVPTGQGVAYSARLHHPTLGAVGLIVNRGDGGGTLLHSYDPARFGPPDLLQFLDESEQDGQPMATDPIGMETLLDAIIEEQDTAHAVETMRRTRTMLVRAYQPRTPGGFAPVRHVPVPCTPILTRRAEREHLTERLAADPGTRLPHGAWWQMFTGTDWDALLRYPPHSTHQITRRHQRAAQLFTDTSTDTGRHLSAVPFVDGLYLTGTTTRYQLLADTTPTLDATQWCTCPAPAPSVRFELWDDGFAGSGTIHSAPGCRRLTHLD